MTRKKKTGKTDADHSIIFDFGDPEMDPIYIKQFSHPDYKRITQLPAPCKNRYIILPRRIILEYSGTLENCEIASQLAEFSTTGLNFMKFMIASYHELRLGLRRYELSKDKSLTNCDDFEPRWFGSSTRNLS